jgi:sugar phosphate isomerase/epimerase
MPMAASPFAVNTYSYTLSHRVRDCLEGLVRRGYAEFELMMYPGHLWPADTDAGARQALRSFVESNGVAITTLNMPNVDVNIAAATAEMRAYSLASLRAIVELAGDLGAEGVVIGPGKANPLLPAPTPTLTGHFHAALDELLPLARRAGVELWVENMPFAFLPGISELVAAIDAYGDDSVGIVYDVANGHFVGEDIAEGLRACRERLRLVHLSDTGRSLYRHDPVGFGTVDFSAVPGVLHEIGHARRPMLEIISANADRDIDDSATRLAALPWPGAAERRPG